MPWAALTILAASLFALLAAMSAQMLFGIEPCVLCLFQRIPYAAALIFSALALLFRRHAGAVRILMILTALSFLANVGIAFFHSGVERLWWEGTNSCAVTPLGQDLSQLSAAQLLATAISECDEINFSILGLTLANLNVLAGLALATLALIAGFGLAEQKTSGGCCPLCRK